MNNIRCESIQRGMWSRRSSLGVLLVCLLAGMAWFSASCEAKTYFFTKIADESTSIPGQGGFIDTFVGFGTPALDGDQVVFGGIGLGFRGIIQSKDNGVVQNSDRSLAVLASNSTPIPNSPSNQNFGDFLLPDVDGDYYVFYGAPDLFPTTLGIGLYLLERRTSPGIISTFSVIADSQTPMPGSPKETFYFIPSLQASIVQGTVTYPGKSRTPDLNQVDQMGIYQYHTAAGTTGYVADRGTVIPNTGGQIFEHFSRVSSYGANAAFVGYAPNPAPGSNPMRGVYMATSFTAPQVVADRTTTIPTPPPGENGKFSLFGSTAISSTTVAFSGTGAKSAGIYAKELNATNITKIVDTNTLAPGAGTNFSNFHTIAMDNSRSLAFIGHTVQNAATVDALYVQSLIDNSLTRVIGRGDKLDGKVVDRFDFRQEGFDGPSTAFHVKYADDTEAVYLAEPPVNLLSGPAYVPTILDPTRHLRIDLAFGSTGAGITEALYLALTEPPSSDYQEDYREFVVEGPAFASIVLPAHLTAENPASLFLYDEETGNFADQPIFLGTGEPFDLLSVNPNGFRKFRLTGLPMAVPNNDEQPDPLGFGAVGVTFLEASDTMASLMIVGSPVPEPSSILLVMLGIGITIGRFRRFF